MFRVTFTDDGEYDFDAASMEFDDGALLFNDEDGNLVAAVAAGEWVDVSSPDEEDEGEDDCADCE